MGDRTNSKIILSKNLSKQTFNLTISTPIDSNTNIKTLIDINPYIFDQKIECGNGKAIITGKLGVKVLFFDTDNITNTISDSVSFTETYADSSINEDTFLNIFNTIITPNVLSTDGVLKINFDITILPVAYLNFYLPQNLEGGNSLICKKNEITTNSISQIVNSNFDFVCNFETKHSVDKILSVYNYFSPENIIAQEGYAVIEGKILTSIIFESINENNSIVKELVETTPLKQDVEISGLTKDCCFDFVYSIDKSREEISTESDSGHTEITLKNKICFSGAVLKDISIEVVDDIYSTENEIETSIIKNVFTKKDEDITITESINSEITLADNEPAIDELIANLNISPVVTNTYIKNNNICLEGIVSSNTVYIDENKETKHKTIEIPFIVDTKIPADNVNHSHASIHVIDSRIKVKRGTIIELDYNLFIKLSVYETRQIETINSFKIGKPVNNSKYDIQLFIARPNETMWDLCKRIKISPNEIGKYNKNLPLIMQGGEKIIIKR